MEQVQIRDYGPLRVLEITTTKGDSEHVHAIPLQAIATWSELLGYADPLETVAAIRHVAAHGEPDPDPHTGANVWTDPYTLLTYREQERERAAMAAQAEGRHRVPQSPQARATLAAHNAVHQPIDGGECAMDRCRRAARDRLGLPHPATSPGAASRGTPITTTTDTTMAASSEQDDLAAALAPHLPEIAALRDEFLHDLTGSHTNPLADTPAPEPEPDPVAATLARYTPREHS